MVTKSTRHAQSHRKFIPQPLNPDCHGERHLRCIQQVTRIPIWKSNYRFQFTDRTLEVNPIAV